MKNKPSKQQPISRELTALLFESALRPYTEILRISAIWIDKHVKTAKDLTRRITKGDLIYLKDDMIVDVQDQPSHVIIETRGTLNNSILLFDTKNLLTNKIETLRYERNNRICRI